MSSVQNILSSRLRRCVFVLSVSALTGVTSANAAEKVLHSFKDGSDGAYPFGALVADATGNLYGTTSNGGGGTDCQGSQGCGTIFKLAPSGTESVLYAFAGGSDGALPHSGLIVDDTGNLYGTTLEGGSSDAGTVFKLAPNKTESVLYAFAGSTDGAFPSSGVIADANGNFYGTTGEGGDMADCGGFGCGVVFEIDSIGHESVLYAFTGGSDGRAPSGGVIRDGNGNLYGETASGGIDCGNTPPGCGTVFQLTPGGTESILHTFQGGSDGIIPSGGLISDNAGNFYGTTEGGGGSCDCGTVFKLAPDGTETVLYAFNGGLDGDIPEGGLITDKKGNLYGTTFYGGNAGCKGNGIGCGVVFKVTPSGKETVLYTFSSKTGRSPAAALLMGKKNILYGTTTAGGGHNDGVVFSVTTK